MVDIWVKCILRLWFSTFFGEQQSLASLKTAPRGKIGREKSILLLASVGPEGLCRV